MEEDEIDGWYEEEKQKCMDDYLKEIENSANHDDAERRFDAKMEKLMEKYSRLMEERLTRGKSAKLDGKLGKVFSSITGFFRARQ